MEDKKHEEKAEEKMKAEQEKQVEQKLEDGIEDKQLREVKSEKKKEPEKIKKEKAIIDVRSLAISTKHSMAICDFIRGKTPEQVIGKLEQVVKLKRAIPMKGEIPHRKGMMSGRYPVNAAKVFIKLIKQLNGNASVNGIENPYISLAKANKASRPHRRGGSMRFKRTNVVLEAREMTEKGRRDRKNKKQVEQSKKSMTDKHLINKPKEKS